MTLSTLLRWENAQRTSVWLLRGVSPLARRRALRHPAHRVDAIGMAVLIGSFLTV